MPWSRSGRAAADCALIHLGPRMGWISAHARPRPAQQPGDPGLVGADRAGQLAHPVLSGRLGDPAHQRGAQAAVLPRVLDQHAEAGRCGDRADVQVDDDGWDGTEVVLGNYADEAGDPGGLRPWEARVHRRVRAR